jgi:hypothetical protein
MSIHWVIYRLFSVNVVKYVLKALAMLRQSLHFFPSISIDEIPWLHFVLLVSDLIMCHEVFNLLLEVNSRLLYYLFLAVFMTSDRVLQYFL